MLSIRQWRPRHLLASWIAYWLLLLLWVARHPLTEYWRVTHSPSGHGTVNASFSFGGVQAALWIAGPPLAIFAVWLATRSRHPDVRTPERERERL